MEQLPERRPAMGRTVLLRRRGTAPALITTSLCSQSGAAGSPSRASLPDLHLTGAACLASLPDLHLTGAAGLPQQRPTEAGRTSRPSIGRQTSAPADDHECESGGPSRCDDSTSMLPSLRRASSRAQREAGCCSASETKSNVNVSENRTRPCRCSLTEHVDTDLRQMIFDTMKKLHDRTVMEVNQRAAEQARRSYCSMMDTYTNTGFLSVEGLTQAHDKALEMAVDMFECLKEGDAATSMEALANLKCDIAYQRIHYVQVNNMKSKRPSFGDRLRKFASK